MRELQTSATPAADTDLHHQRDDAEARPWRGKYKGTGDWPGKRAVNPRGATADRKGGRHASPGGRRCVIHIGATTRLIQRMWRRQATGRTEVMVGGEPGSSPPSNDARSLKPPCNELKGTCLVVQRRFTMSHETTRQDPDEGGLTSPPTSASSHLTPPPSLPIFSFPLPRRAPTLQSGASIIPRPSNQNTSSPLLSAPLKSEVTKAGLAKHFGEPGTKHSPTLWSSASQIGVQPPWTIWHRLKSRATCPRRRQELRPTGPT